MRLLIRESVTFLVAPPPGLSFDVRVFERLYNSSTVQFVSGSDLGYVAVCVVAILVQKFRICIS